MKRRSLKKMRSVSKLALVAALLLGAASGAQAATVIWDFNLPATGISSLNPPYPSLGLLTLEDSTCGGSNCVKFTFDPNEGNPGYNPGGATSTIDRLTVGFKTSESDETALQSVHQLTSITGTGMVAVDSWDWSQRPPANDDNLDAGYATGEGQFSMNWNNPNFPVEDISMWTILNTTIASNFSVMGTANNKPSPTFGVLSVSPKIVVQDSDGDNVTPTPSNWVTGESAQPPAVVPIPAAAWLFASALGVFGYFGKRKAMA